MKKHVYLVKFDFVHDVGTKYCVEHVTLLVKVSLCIVRFPTDLKVSRVNEPPRSWEKNFGAT